MLKYIINLISFVYFNLKNRTLLILNKIFNHHHSFYIIVCINNHLLCLICYNIKKNEQTYLERISFLERKLHDNNRIIPSLLNDKF